MKEEFQSVCFDPLRDELQRDPRRYYEFHSLTRSTLQKKSRGACDLV
jgi:hypothetical protein